MKENSPHRPLLFTETSSRTSPFLFSATHWAGRLDPVWPGRLRRDKIESFNRQTDHPGAPHIHHAVEISEGGSTVQLDYSANTLQTRKLEHGVH